MWMFHSTVVVAPPVIERRASLPGKSSASSKFRLNAGPVPADEEGEAASVLVGGRFDDKVLLEGPQNDAEVVDGSVGLLQHDDREPSRPFAEGGDFADGAGTDGGREGLSVEGCDRETVQASTWVMHQPDRGIK